MVEREVIRLYKRLKNRTIAAIKRDEVFSDFVRILSSGKRVYKLHNSEQVKSIDEDWVKAIEDCVPHLDSIVNNPRRYMKQRDALVPVELAKKTTPASVRHLATNTQYVKRVEGENVVPSKVLSSYHEESFELYENRFVATLLTRVSQFIDRRYVLLGERGGDELTSVLSAEGSFRQNDEDTDYRFDIKVHQGSEYLGGRGVAAEIFERLEAVRSYVNAFKRSRFMREMSSVSPVRPPIMNTNLLSKDPDYRACYKLWRFMDGYDKVGYRIDVTDTAPEPDEELISDIDASVLFQYLILKYKMGEYFAGRTDAAYRKKRTVRPKFVTDYNKDVPQSYALPQHSVLKVALDGSNAREVNAKLRQALNRAIVIENRKKKLENREQRLEENTIAAVIQNALYLEGLKKRRERKLSAAQEKQMAEYLDSVLELARKRRMKPEHTAELSAPEESFEEQLESLGELEQLITRRAEIEDVPEEPPALPLREVSEENGQPSGPDSGEEEGEEEYLFEEAEDFGEEEAGSFPDEEAEPIGEEETPGIGGEESEETAQEAAATRTRGRGFGAWLKGLFAHK